MTLWRVYRIYVYPPTSVPPYLGTRFPFIRRSRNDTGILARLGIRTSAHGSLFRRSDDIYLDTSESFTYEILMTHNYNESSHEQ